MSEDNGGDVHSSRTTAGLTKFCWAAGGRAGRAVPATPRPGQPCHIIIVLQDWTHSLFVTTLAWSLPIITDQEPRMKMIKRSKDSQFLC